MAGEWIKVRTDLPTDPAVMRLCAILGMDTGAVIGRLVMVWVWADTHADRHGRVALVSRDSLDAVTQCPGFGAAMEQVRWLESSTEEGGGVVFPRFDRHMGEGAKARAQAAKRKRKQRERASSQQPGSVTQESRSQRDKFVTREEKRREEKKGKEEPPIPPAKPGGVESEPAAEKTGTEGESKTTAPIPAELDTEGFRAAWGEWKAERAAKRLKPYTPRGEGEQFRKLAPFGPTAAIAAIRESIAQGWQGLFPRRDPPTVATGPTRQPAPDLYEKLRSQYGSTPTSSTGAPCPTPLPSPRPTGSSAGSPTTPGPSG